MERSGLLSKFTGLAFLLSILIVSCTSEKDSKSGKQKKSEPEPEAQSVKIPSFNEDSCYSFLETIVSFGPRVPNTQPHLITADYLIRTLKSYGAEVNIQKANVKAYNGTVLSIQNIQATFNPEARRSVLLCTHWDTRPVADMDSVNTENPIDGANDGGSGTAMLLEIARLIKSTPPDIGVEMIFFDAEDYGVPKGKVDNSKGATSYCLGSQYWAKRWDPNRYLAEYGILLDMVGAKDAIFKREKHSMEFAGHIVDRVWSEAASLGYGSIFVNQPTGYVMDDHVFVNQYAGIPCIDIIEFDSSDPDGAFGHYWHTHSDNMDIISKKTLKAVGQTVVNVLYKEVDL